MGSTISSSFFPLKAFRWVLVTLLQISNELSTPREVMVDQPTKENSERDVVHTGTICAMTGIFFCFFQNFGGSRATETYPNLTYGNVESGYNTHKELLTGVFGG